MALNGPSELNEQFKVKTVIDPTSLTPESAQEETLKSKFLVEAGVVNKVDLLVEDKGISRSEAIEFLRQKEEENKIVGPVDQRGEMNNGQ